MEELVTSEFLKVLSCFFRLTILSFFLFKIYLFDYGIFVLSYFRAASLCACSSGQSGERAGVAAPSAEGIYETVRVKQPRCSQSQPGTVPSKKDSLRCWEVESDTTT